MGENFDAEVLKWKEEFEETHTFGSTHQVCKQPRFIQELLLKVEYIIYDPIS